MVLVQRKLTRSVSIKSGSRAGPFKRATSKGLSKTQAKSVATIAKKVTMKAAETKSAFRSIASANMYDGLIYARNLCYFMSQGTGSELYIGEKIWLKNIHLKGQLAFTNLTDGISSTYRLLVVRSNNIWTNSVTNPTYTDIFRGSSSNSVYGSALHTDNHKITVIYDSGAKVAPKNFKDNISKAVFDINLNISKSHFWTADGSGSFKNGDYFLVYMAENGPATGNIATILFDYTVNFKDE